MKFTNKEFNERFESLLLSKKILEKFKIKYFLEGGVFLGLIRDKDFISWDNDIELAVFSEDIFGKEYMIANELVKNGFDIKFVDNSYKDFKINAYLYNHTKISILSYYLDGKYRRRHLLRYLAIFFDNPSEVKIKNENFRSVSKDYLNWTYKNWKVPEKTNIQKNYFKEHVFANRNYLKLLIIKIKFYISFLIHGATNLYNKYFIPREKNFLYIINKLKPHCKTMIDIGSSDGIETITFLKNNNNNKVIIFEPQEKIFNLLKSKFKKNKKVIIKNLAISDKNKTINFYENYKKNLSSIIYDNKSKERRVDSISLDNFFSINSLTDPILLKFDIEGGEFELLKGFLDTLLSNKTFYLLFELHPTKYNNNDRNFKSIIELLFANGFYTLYAESALIPIPEIFKKENLKPIAINNNRGLYENVSNEFILNNAFDKKLEFLYPSWINSKYTISNKSIRSICITNYKIV